VFDGVALVAQVHAQPVGEVRIVLDEEDPSGCANGQR
jgi:hypothetical protein